jgi:O-antigen ligase
LGAVRLARPWVAVAFITLLVASDYQVRRRDADLAISGRADAAVIVELCLYVAVAAWAVWTFYGARKLHWPTRSLMALWVYVGVLVASLAYTVYPMLAVVRVVQFVIAALLCHIVSQYAAREQMDRLRHGFISVVAASTLFGVIVPFPDGEDRFSWLFVHPIVSGIYLGLAVVLTTGYLMSTRATGAARRWSGPAYAVVLSICVGGLLATRTRAAIVGAAIACLVMSSLIARARGRFNLVIAVPLVAVLIALAAGPQVMHHLARDQSAADLQTLNSRAGLWQEAFDLAGRQPVLGYGVEASRGLLLESTGLGGGHNAFVNVLLDSGVVGVAAWLTLLWVLFAQLRRLRRWGGAVRAEASVLLGVLSFLAINAMTYEGMGAPSNVAMTWLLVIVAWANVIERTAAARHATSPVASGRAEIEAGIR